jgi:site-specific DNA-cytosine methylase
MKIGVIDLFCGIGGLSYGFHKRGFRMLAGVDSDESCKYAFEANIKAPFIAKSVSSAIFDLQWTASEKGQGRRSLGFAARVFKARISCQTGRYLYGERSSFEIAPDIR